MALFQYFLLFSILSQQAFSDGSPPDTGNENESMLKDSVFTDSLRQTWNTILHDSSNADRRELVEADVLDSIIISVKVIGDKAKDLCRKERDHFCKDFGDVECEFTDMGFAYIGPKDCKKGDTCLCMPFVKHIEVNEKGARIMKAMGNAQETILIDINVHMEPSWSRTQDTNPTWNLDGTDGFGSSVYDHSYTSNNGDGEGVIIYVLDTGINQDHDDFEDRVIGGQNFVGAGSSYADTEGHGTLVAGLSAGFKYGTSKKAKLKIGRVCAPAPVHCPTESIINAIQWACDDIKNNKYLGVINMSINNENPVAALNDAVEAAFDNGCLSVSAAGNDNKDACTSSPAMSHKTVTVGAIDINMAKSGFSNFGGCIDIHAYGTAVVGPSHDSNSGSIKDKGTSLSAPAVSGVVANIMSSYRFTGYSKGDLGFVLDKLYLGPYSADGLISGLSSGTVNRVLKNFSGPTTIVLHTKANAHDYATCAGTYTLDPKRSINGRQVYVSAERYRFIAWSTSGYDSGQWVVTGSQWIDQVSGSFGGFHGNSNGGGVKIEDSLWESYTVEQFAIVLDTKEGGSNYATCAGTYTLDPERSINGREVYVSDERYRFIAWSSSRPDSGRWVLTGSQWIDQVSGSFGGFHGSSGGVKISDSLWKNYNVVTIPVDMTRRRELDTSIISSIETKVSCGTHRATSCQSCPRGTGVSWCEGDCVLTNGKCTAKQNRRL